MDDAKIKDQTVEEEVALDKMVMKGEEVKSKEEGGKEVLEDKEVVEDSKKVLLRVKVMQRVTSGLLARKFDVMRVKQKDATVAHEEEVALDKMVVEREEE